MDPHIHDRLFRQQRPMLRQAAFRGLQQFPHA